MLHSIISSVLAVVLQVAPPKAAAPEALWTIQGETSKPSTAQTAQPAMEVRPNQLLIAMGRRLLHRKLALPLNDRVVVGVVDFVEAYASHREGYGHLVDEPGGTFTFVSRGGVFRSAVRMPTGGIYDVLTAAAGKMTIGQRAPADSNLLPCISAEPAPRPFGIEPPCPTSITTLRGYAADDGSTVDVMVVYTPAARDAAGGVSQIEANIDMAAMTANQAMANSLISTRIHIIRKALINYTESGDAITDLNRLVAPNDGYLDSVHADRDTYGADLVSLWVGTLNAGGVAYELSALDGDDDGRAGFSVLLQSQSGVETFAHELGHNFGCQHDRLNAQGVGFFPYSYGYREPGGLWRDLMAYPPGTALLNYSNPNVFYSGPLGDPGPEGVPGNDANSSCNNALTIINTSWTLANFRPAHLTGTPPARVYVRASASTNGDGSSWATAFRDLQDGIGRAVASRGITHEVWVAAGTYKPDRGRGDRLMNFRLVNGVSIFGGFAGSETQLSQRDPAANVCTLSGDIGTSGDSSDNSYHVLNTVDLDSSAVLDGFTITAGNANGSFPHDSGGGLYNQCGNPTITNCKFMSNMALNRGGAAGLFEGAGTFTACTFSNNTAQFGGAVYSESGAAPQFVNCIFTSNAASGFAGAMRNWTSSPVLTGCTFSQNSAVDVAAVENSYGAAPSLSNCTFSNNFTQYDGAMSFYQSGGSIQSCTFTQNSSSNYAGGLELASSSSPTIAHCSFNANTAYAGGGVYCSGGSNGTFIDCVFTGNTGVFAGGMYNYGAAPTLTGCAFTQNVGGTNGSGTGGAIENDAASSPSISNCTFTQNTAGCCGGTIINTGGSAPTIRLCTFAANAANFGAGIWCADPGSNAQVTNCLFFGNIAQFGGGAIHTTNSAAPRYVDCVFSGNHVPVGNGGVADDRSSSAASFINCTLSGNSAGFTCGGVINDACTSAITNSILWNNSDAAGTNSASQLTATNAGSFVVSYSIVQGGFGGTANLTTNPEFVDADGPDNILGTPDDNLRVQPGSPAIDSANATALPPGVTIDPGLAARLIDDPLTANTGAGSPPYLDRGAYEFLPAVSGDVNCDGALTAADVPVFVAALLNPSSYMSCDLLRGDINHDGHVDGADVGPFVHALVP